MTVNPFHLVAIIIAAALLAGCSESSTNHSPVAEMSQPAPTPHVENKGQAIDKIAKKIEKERMSALSIHCMAFITTADNTNTYTIDVREKHNDVCGGDPQTSPRLFSFIVDKRTGNVTLEDND